MTTARLIEVARLTAKSIEAFMPFNAAALVQAADECERELNRKLPGNPKPSFDPDAVCIGCGDKAPLVINGEPMCTPCYVLKFEVH
jgi:hypothetical protein